MKSTDLKRNRETDIKSRLAELGVRFGGEVPAKASFIMPDGSFLGLEENADAIWGCEMYPSHSSFERFLIRNGIRPSERDNLLGDYGAIQINDGTYDSCECAYAHIKSKPNEPQAKSLLKWLDCLMTAKKRVTIKTPNLLRVYSFPNKSNLDGDLPDDILKDIC